MKRIVFIIVTIALLCVNCPPVKAEIHTGFETSVMSRQEKLENHYHYKIQLYHQPQKGLTKINNIAINHDGTRIALGFSSRKIEVYDPDGNFIIGYKVNTTGGFGMEFDSEDDQLCISLIRDESIFKINSQGELLDSAWIKHTIQNANYQSDVFNQYEVTNGKNTYKLQGVGNTLLFYKCVKTSPTTSKVIYDKQRQYEILGISVTVILTILVVGFISFIVIKRNKHYLCED